MKNTSLERFGRRSAHVGGGGWLPYDPSPRLLGSSFGPEVWKIEKNTIWKKHAKNAPKKMKHHAERMSEWSRNCTKTNENSIQKQVMGNIMKIIKSHVSLNG